MSLQRQGRKRIRVEKAHNKEKIPMLSVMEPNYRPDGSVTYLKVSVDPPKYRERHGADPFKPVFLTRGERKFRGVSVPNYIKPHEVGTELIQNIVYMGMSLPSTGSETCLVEPLQLAAIPTIVHGLADIVVSKPVFDNMVPGNAVYWPDGDEGIRIGRMMQTVVEPTEFMSGRVRICVDSVGECIVRQS